MPVLREIWSMCRAGFHLPKGRRQRMELHGLNPTELDGLDYERRPVILVHGQGHNQSAWIDLAQGMIACEEVGPLFTFNYSDVDEGVIALRAKVAEVAAMYRGHGPHVVEFVLVGHSLGAIVSGLYAFCEAQAPGTRVHSMISVAGRLKVVGARFRWAYRSLVEQLQLLQEHIVPHRLATVAAGRDWLVPREAVHVGCTLQRYTVGRTSHLSVLHAPETIRFVVDQLCLREKLKASVFAVCGSFSQQLAGERRVRGRSRRS